MRPTPRLVQLAALLTLLGAVVSVVPALQAAWSGAAAAFAVVGLLEVLVLRRRPVPTVHREQPATQFLETWNDVSVRLDAKGRARTTLVLTDHATPDCELDGVPTEVVLEPKSWLKVTYRSRPMRRGTMVWGPLEMLIRGPLGLLDRRVRVEQADEIKVYPDFRPVARYALLALDRRLNQMGIHLQRRRGEGLEFFQLREYREGDSLRQIDWKAVSRRNQLISREYQDEQNQQVVFLLDCGRRMRAREPDGRAHFDHVLNAVLLLSYVALRLRPGHLRGSQRLRGGGQALDDSAEAAGAGGHGDQPPGRRAPAASAAPGDDPQAARALGGESS
jgi:uncharacterized protein (DUF58 family)